MPPLSDKGRCKLREMDEEIPNKGRDEIHKMKFQGGEIREVNPQLTIFPKKDIHYIPRQEMVS